MRQVLISGGNDVIESGYDQFSSIHGTRIWTAGEVSAWQIVSTPGTISNLHINLQVAPGVGKSITFTFRVNGADTDLTCTISETDTTGQDLAHVINVAAGDYIDLKASPSSGIPAGIRCQNSTLFHGTNVNESLLLGGTYDNLNDTTTEYNAIQGSTNWTSIEGYAPEIIPTNGVIKNLYVRLDDEPGDGKSYAFTLMKNGVAQALTLTIANAATTGSDTVNTVTVAPGDTVSLRCVPTGTPTVRDAFWGSTFTADIDGESLLLGTCFSGLITDETRYTSICAYAEYWPGIEAIAYELLDEAILKKFYVKLLDGSPGAGKSYTFTIRKNGINTPIEVIIVDANTTGNTDRKLSFFTNDLVNLAVTPSGTPTSRSVSWGLVSYAKPDGYMTFTTGNLSCV